MIILCSLRDIMQQRTTGFVRNVRESVGRGAGDTRTAVHPPILLLPPAAAVETDALEELPARDLVLHLLLYAAGRVAGELVDLIRGSL